jgi:Kae1-associated kinase Bud32
MEKRKKILAQGAEAVIYQTGKKVIKDRVKKNYRLPEIDSKLRWARTKKEAKLMRELKRAGISVPNVLEERGTVLEIEFIDGEKVRDYLDKTKDVKICKQIGIIVGKMHRADIVHGDLTTSNLILKGKKLYIIDLGLGEFSKRIEDKAVDLHLFKECLVSKHHLIWEKAWKKFVEGYEDKVVLDRLSVVESRGRYKSALQ